MIVVIKVFINRVVVVIVFAVKIIVVVVFVYRVVVVVPVVVIQQFIIFSSTRNSLLQKWW